jgi:hypothetical protein
MRRAGTDSDVPDCEPKESPSLNSTSEKEPIVNGQLKAEPFPFRPPERPHEEPRLGKRTCDECHDWKPAYNGQKPADVCEGPCKGWDSCPTKYLKGEIIFYSQFLIFPSTNFLRPS